MHAYLAIDNVKQWQFCKYAMHWKLNKSTGRKKNMHGPEASRCSGPDEDSAQVAVCKRNGKEGKKWGVWGSNPVPP